MISKKLKIIIIILLKTIFIISSSFASNIKDCRNSSFYIKNINVDFTKKSIIQARELAEQKARLIGLNRLLNKLTLRNKNLTFKNSEVLQLVDYLKINNEANSNTRYVADFDICFNRSLVINYFHKNKLQYAHTHKKPISILPIFKGPRGFILWDQKDVWYSQWKKQLKSVDGLVKLYLAKGNLNLSRSIGPDIITKPNKDLIKKLIQNENTNALLIVIAEPVLRNDGKTYLSTYAKIYNSDGNLENTIYNKKTPLKTTLSIFNVDELLLNEEVLNIIESIEKKHKKDNLIDPNIYNEVDLIIPLVFLKSTTLESPLLFNDKNIKVKSTGEFLDEGIIKIESEFIYYKFKTLQKFENITRSLLNSESKIEYKVNSKINQKDISNWPLVLDIMKNLPFVKEVKVISISNNRGRIIVSFIGNKKTFFQAVAEKKMIFKDFNSEQYILTY